MQVAEARTQAQAQASEAAELRKELQRANAQLQRQGQAQPTLSLQPPMPSLTAQHVQAPMAQALPGPEGVELPPPVSSAAPPPVAVAPPQPATATQPETGSGAAVATAAAPLQPAASRSAPQQQQQTSAATMASPRNIAAAKAYAAALAAEGHPVSADALLSGVVTKPSAEQAAGGGSSKPDSARADASLPAPAGADEVIDRVDSSADASAPTRPPGVTQRLYTTILHMSVAALKGMLTRAGIPHADCREKNDLRERLLQAVEKGQSLSPTANARSSHGFSGPGSTGSSSVDAAPFARPGVGEPARDAASSGATSASGSIPSQSSHPDPGSLQSDQPGEDQHGPSLQQRQRASSVRSAAGPGGAEGGGASDRSERVAAEAAQATVSDAAASHSSSNTSSPQKPPLSLAAAGTDATKAPSPQELKNWLPARAPDGAVYYYHRITRAVRWDKPEGEIAKKMEARILGVSRALPPPPRRVLSSSLAPFVTQEDAAVKARQAERLAGLAADHEQARQAAAQKTRIESEVDSRVKIWSRGKGIRQLLVSLHTVLTTRSVPDYISGGASVSASAEELKKTYHKAIRLVHPDKVAAAATLEAQIEAQKVFAVLSEAYKKYTDAEGAGGGGLASFTSAAQTARRPAGGTADMPSFGSFGAGSSGISGAAARARAAFNAMHTATRGSGAPPGPGVGGTAQAPGASGIRFTSFSAHTGYHAAGGGWGATGGPSAPSGSSTSR